MAEVRLDKLRKEDRDAILKAQRNASYARQFIKSRFWVDVLRPLYTRRLERLREKLEDGDDLPMEIIRALQAQIREIKTLLGLPAGLILELPQIEEEILASTESQTPGAAPPWWPSGG